MSDTSNQQGAGPSGQGESEADELERAKQRLLEAGNNVAERGIAFAKRHPYVCTGAALAAGLVVGRVPYLRKVVLATGMWAGKHALERYAKGK